MTTAATETNGQTALVPAPALKTASALVPQYAQGFEGAASGAFPPEALKILVAPVPEGEVEVKPNGIVYLPGVAYRRILIRAFGAGAWALLPRGPARRDGETVIYHGALYILGRFVSEAVGECETRGGMSYASSLEGARTDCLTRCCKDLGMAAELWDPDWRGGWQAKYCKKEWNEKTGKYVFKKLDKPNGAPAPIAGRNSGGSVTQFPVAATDKGLASAAEVGRGAKTPVDENSDSGQTPSEQGVNLGDGGERPASSDTGEAPAPDELAAIRAAAKKLGWAKPKATSWLRLNFGQTTVDALTKAQAEAAMALLLAAQLDDNDAEYSKVFTRLKAEGKVLG